MQWTQKVHTPGNKRWVDGCSAYGSLGKNCACFFDRFFYPSKKTKKTGTNEKQIPVEMW